VTPHSPEIIETLYLQYKEEAAKQPEFEKARFKSAMAGYATFYTKEETRKQLELLSMLRDVMCDFGVCLPTLGAELDTALGDNAYAEWIKEYGGLLSSSGRGSVAR